MEDKNEYKYLTRIDYPADLRKFKVEELPIDPSDPEPPKTGDSSAILFHMSLMGVSLAALLLLLPLSRKRRQTQ